MKLYNRIIEDTLNLLSSYSGKILKVQDDVSWEMCDYNELILSKDAAFEMGASRFPSVNYSCVTTSSTLIEKDEILLYGPDLNEIDCDVPFGRIVLLNTKELKDDETGYKAIKNLEYVKYDIIPKGYMIRGSSFNRREQVRVSREAISKGINFQTIGNVYIKKLKENNLVKAVRIIFVTENILEFKNLTEFARNIDGITETFNHILNNMNFDCQSCDLKPICQEVEGMKELHFNSRKSQ